MERETCREQVGALVLDLLPTARVVHVLIYQEQNGVLDYAIIRTDHYDVKMTARFVWACYKERVSDIWYSSNMNAYYFQIVDRWLPGRLWRNGNWMRVDPPVFI